MELIEAIGNTPLIRLKNLERDFGITVYGKAEFMNPGGSVKDRAARGMVEAAERKGLLKKGMRIYEGTAGNTGIGLCLVARAKNYPCTIVMPNNQSEEKIQMLQALGAELHLVPPVPFKDENHFYHQAQRLAAGDPLGFWVNQFENLDNASTHFQTTGPEIWQAVTDGALDGFACATGTGGTLAGVSRYLKQQDSDIKIGLIDPLGSGLYNWFHHGEIKSTGSSITEGIGIMRLTAQIQTAKIDDAFQVDDQMMYSCLLYLAKSEGLFVGPSAALNVAGSLLFARKWGLKKVATILCDGGARYQNRLLSQPWIESKGLQPIPFASLL